MKDIQNSFRKFADLVPDTGCIIANGDDVNTTEALAGKQYLRFGFSETNDIYGADFSPDWRTFDVFCEGSLYTRLQLSVVGRHNALNAIAACAAAYHAGIPGDVASAALSTFSGAGRRMEYKGSFHGADIYDDYAHHPGELRALLTSVRSLHYQRVICAFQPHTYTRTSAFLDEFVQVLKTADIPVLTEIYAARERNLIGISSKMISDQIPGSVFCPTLQDVTAYCPTRRPDFDRRRR